MKKYAVLGILCLFALICPSDNQAQRGGIEFAGDEYNILPLWEQARFMERQLKWRQTHVVPLVMRRAQVDMWIVSREEGVLYLSLLPGDKEGLIPDEPEHVILCDRGVDLGMERILNDDSDLKDFLRSRRPSSLAVNREAIGSYQAMLGTSSGCQVVSSREIGIFFLQTRSPEEISVFHHVARIAHRVIAEAFSNQVVIPDVTTTDELNWWIRQRYRDLGLLTSDHPTITLQRSLADRSQYPESDEHFRIDIPPRNGYNSVIRRGDVISCDTGINYLGLGTDTQQVAYVLRASEIEAPKGLQEAMRRTNRLQDIFAAEFQDGRSGNDIWLAALNKARNQNLRPSIYSHPIPLFIMRYEENGGFYENVRYFAGPGLGSEHSDTPRPSGRLPVYLNTAYAMELHTMTAVSEWGGQDVRITLEQTVAFTPQGLEFLGGRQTEWYLIK